MPERAPGRTPSPLFTEHVDTLRDAGRLGPVLDLACGRGRHAVPAAAAGLPVVGVDRSATFLAELRARAPAGHPVPCVRTDLEAEAGIPFAAASCGAILVFRFLFRPLAPAIASLLAPGGLLLYETFTVAQRDLAWGPSNPAFLLAPGELPALFPDLEMLQYAELCEGDPRPDAIARLAARKPAR